MARRAPFDRAARHVPFVEVFVAQLPDDAHVVSLGGGIGTPVQWLRAQARANAQWRYTVVDPDEALLAAVPEGLGQVKRRSLRELASWDVRVDGVLVAELDTVDADGIALIAEWVAQLECPVLAGPTRDGELHWQPSHERDHEVMAAVRVHQRAMAVGPHAADWFADLLRLRRYDVELAEANWRVSADDRSMVRRLVEDTAQVALQIHPNRDGVEAWRQTRMLQARVNVLEVRVGQRDLLGLPGR